MKDEYFKSLELKIDTLFDKIDKLDNLFSKIFPVKIENQHKKTKIEKKEERVEFLKAQ